MKKQTKIELESDVRCICRGLWGKRALWVEPAPGSSSGTPDCWLNQLNGKGKWVELKRGWIKDQLIVFKFRAMQVKVIDELLRTGHDVRLVVGIVGTMDVFWGPIGTCHRDNFLPLKALSPTEGAQQWGRLKSIDSEKP